MSFKVGDVVKLKSGGPLMTVAAVEGDDIHCEWFDHKKEPQARSFPAGTLKSDSGPSAPALL